MKKVLFTAHTPIIDKKKFVNYSELVNLAKTSAPELSKGGRRTVHIRPQKSFEKIIKIFNRNGWHCFINPMVNVDGKKIVGWDIYWVLSENKKFAIVLYVHKNCYELMVRSFEKHFDFHESRHENNKIGKFLSKIINPADYPQFYPQITEATNEKA
jgi:lauroyl/myristoyl acyltransferase